MKNKPVWKQPFWKQPKFAWRVNPIFRWFDFYVGVFYDKPRKFLYIFYFPMCGLKIRLFGEKQRATNLINMMSKMLAEHDRAKKLSDSELSDELKNIGVFNIGSREEALLDQAIDRLEIPKTESVSSVKSAEALQPATNPPEVPA